MGFVRIFYVLFTFTAFWSCAEAIFIGIEPAYLQKTNSRNILLSDNSQPTDTALKTEMNKPKLPSRRIGWWFISKFSQINVIRYN